MIRLRLTIAGLHCHADINNSNVLQYFNPYICVYIYIYIIRPSWSIGMLLIVFGGIYIFIREKAQDQPIVTEKPLR